jgi:DNA-binding PadR family transcriptional regulator
LEIADDAEIGTTTVYDILMKLEHSGWVQSQWESTSPRQVGRPRRRLYRLTGLGESSAQEAIEGELARLNKMLDSASAKKARSRSRHIPSTAKATS